MAKKPTLNDFSHIEDPELRKELEAIVAKRQAAAKEIPPEVDQHPKFVFSRATPNREPGAKVQVRNGLDDELRGGEILERVGRAFRVDVRGVALIVHEPDDSWE